MTLDRLARLDGPRRVAGRPAAGRARRGRRRRARRDGAPRAARRCRGADRRRAVLAVLGHGPADARVRGARAPARPAAAHAPRRDGRGGGLLPRALRLPPGRVPRAARLARRRRLVRALRPPRTTTTSRHVREREASASRTARRRTCASAPASRACASCSTRGVRVGLGVDGSASNERGDLLFEVKQALLVARGRGGPAALTAREALRLGTRGGAAVLGRDDIGSLEPGKRADLAVWRTDGLELAGASDLVAGTRPLGPAPRRPALRRRRGGRPRRAARQRRRGRDRAAASGPGAKIRRMISTHVLDTRNGGPPSASRSSSTAATSWSRRARRTTTAASRDLAERRARHLPPRLPPAVAVLQADRARGRARRRQLPRPAARSRPSGARSTAAAERRRARGALQRPHALRRAARAAGGSAHARRRADRGAAGRGQGRGARGASAHRGALAGAARRRSRRCSPSWPS